MCCNKTSILICFSIKSYSKRPILLESCSDLVSEHLNLIGCAYYWWGLFVQKSPRIHQKLFRFENCAIFQWHRALRVCVEVCKYACNLDIEPRALSKQRYVSWRMLEHETSRLQTTLLERVSIQKTLLDPVSALKCDGSPSPPCCMLQISHRGWMLDLKDVHRAAASFGKDGSHSRTTMVGISSIDMYLVWSVGEEHESTTCTPRPNALPRLSAD